ncbi:hypothetical protein YC2023_081225 [Brassica napus]
MIRVRLFEPVHLKRTIKPVDPNLDLNIRRILQFLEGYPRTSNPDKDSKITDPPDKDLDPDTLKLSGYLIRPMPSKLYHGDLPKMTQNLILNTKVYPKFSQMLKVTQKPSEITTAPL